MDVLILTLKTTAAAAFGAWLALFAGARLGSPERPRRWAGAALVLALVGAYLVQFGLPTLPFGEDQLRARERVFWMLPLGLVVTLLPWRQALLPLALVAPAVVSGGLGEGLAERLPLAGLMLALAVLCASGERIFRRRDGLHAALQAGLFVGIVAGAIGATGSMAYGQWAGALGTAFGVTLIPAWRAGNAGLLDGGTLALFAGVFLLMAASYSELDPYDAALLIGALPATLLAEDLLESKRGGLAASWLVLLGVAAVVGLRIWLNWESDPYAGYY